MTAWPDRTVPFRRPTEQGARGNGALVGRTGPPVPRISATRALLMPDHFGDQLAPVPALAAVAAATTTLRLGSLVFGNDYRHPFVLAKEAATLDLLSEGRFELSLGAGWMKTDYEEAGLTYDTPRVRVERFEEAVQVVQGLLRTDGPFSFDGALLPGARAHPPPSSRATAGTTAHHRRRRQARAVLRCTARGHRQHQRQPPRRHRRARDGAQHVARADTGEGGLGEGGGRVDASMSLELNALIGFVMITDDAGGIVEAMAPHFGIDVDEALHVPGMLLGTLDEMVDELQWRREEYGITYWSIEADSWEALGPIVSKLSGT